MSNVRLPVHLRVAFAACVLAATTGARAESRSPAENVVYVSIGCPSGPARMLQGKQDAIRDIARGTFIKRKLVGGGYLPPSTEELKRRRVEERIWKKFGVAVKFQGAPHVFECWNPPYEEGYDVEVDKHLRLKLGDGYAERVEREVQRQLRSEGRGRGAEPNPSIERTPYSRLRRPPGAAHVER
jgi:hypothetical protein